MTGGFHIFCHHQSHDVAQIGSAAAFWYEDGPVFVDQSDSEVARHICRREDGDHARHGFGWRGVDAEHIGTGMVCQSDRAVKHVGQENIVYVGAFACCQLGRFVFHARGADPAGFCRLRGFALCQRHHGIKDFHIAGTAAEVPAKVTRGFVAGEVGAFAVYKRLGSHHDAGSAESALKRPVRNESCGEPAAFRLADAFQSHHIGIGDFL